MQDTEHYLRKQLKDKDSKLYDALMRSWDIAEKEWLPAMSSKMGSYNGLPHITGVEAHADNILAQVDNDKAPYETTLRLSPCEKYILLASILFHDIGRIEQSDCHGEYSRAKIVGKHPSLGIEHKHLAEIIGDVCCYHDCSEKTKQNLKMQSLRDRDIEPYGLIRVKPLAILLALFDELDGSYKRVYPYYLETSSLIEGFRRSTSNIRTDVSSMTIVSCTDIDKEKLVSIEWDKMPFSLNGDFLKHEKLANDAPHIEEWYKSVNKVAKGEEHNNEKPTFFPKGSDIVAMINQAEPNEKLKFPRILHDFISSSVNFNPNPLHEDRLSERMVFMSYHKGDFAGKRCVFTTYERTKSFLPFFNANTFKSPFDLSSSYDTDLFPYALVYEVLSYLVLLRLIFVDGNRLQDMREHMKKGKLDNEKKMIDDRFKEIFAVNKFIAIATNVHAAARKLEDLKHELSEYGIPFMAWVLEHDDHLFTWHGQETFEASLDKHFLKMMVDRMWRLAARTFGRKPFKYETLAAILRVDNIKKVKLAVRRIAIISRHRHPEKIHSAIRYTESGWWWDARDDWKDGIPQVSSQVSSDHNVKAILALIENLADPHYVDPFE